MKKKALLLGLFGCLMLTMSACGKEGVNVSLGQYKGVEVTVEPIEVTDEDVQSELDRFNEANGEWSKIEDRTDVQEGDFANIDYVGKVDGVEFDGGKDEDSMLEIGSNSFIEGFESGLIGKNVGETVDVNTTFPDPYTNNPDLAGKEAIFTVTINYISDGKKLPLTDKVVEENTDFTTIEEYKASIRDELTANAESTAEMNKLNDVMTAILDDAKIEGIKQEEIDEEYNTMVSYYTNMATSLYGMNLDDLITYGFQMTREQFDTEMKTIAESSVKQRYVLDEIIEEENLTLTDEEYNAKVAEYVESTSFESVEAFEEANEGKDEATKALLREKAMDLVLEAAIVK